MPKLNYNLSCRARRKHETCTSGWLLGEFTSPPRSHPFESYPREALDARLDLLDHGGGVCALFGDCPDRRDYCVQRAPANRAAQRFGEHYPRRWIPRLEIAPQQFQRPRTGEAEPEESVRGALLNLRTDLPARDRCLPQPLNQSSPLGERAG